MKEIRVIETNVAKGDLLKEAAPLQFVPDKKGPDGNEEDIFNIYDQVQYQEILGFGGAFTEASALNFKGLTEEQQKEVADQYFDAEKGIGYSFCRATINSCDFSADFYSYDDVDGDFELEHFDIAHDKEAVIPMIHTALERSPEMRIFSSPWSPPAWMKTNGKMAKGGSLKKECYDVWARYVAKYIQEYEKAGVHIWGVTVQNESKAAQGWESCIYEAAEERDFVVGYLRPACDRAGLGDRKILCWDHNKERVVDRALETFCSPRARDAFDGMAVHWYAGDHFGALDAAHQLFPEKLFVASEQCKGASDIPWNSGETYAHDIIGDLNNWVNAWVDWNMLLDENGGPDHWKDEQQATGWDPEKIWVGESPIMVKNGVLEYASSYYYIGHFSKFIRPGARRVASSLYTDRLEGCAFKNPDGSHAAVLMNRTDADIKVFLRYKTEIAPYTVQAHSIATFLF